MAIKFTPKDKKPKRQKPNAKESPELTKALKILLKEKAPAKKPTKAEKFDRTAYQREYMRKWRAKKKEAE
jgi:hypothetical protein